MYRGVASLEYDPMPASGRENTFCFIRWRELLNINLYVEMCASKSVEDWKEK